MPKSIVWLIVVLCVSWGAVARASTCSLARDWPAWIETQQRMIDSQGRMIDHSDPRLITTSEGQSYAMFFALVNNDRALFQRLTQWLQDNLAKGDLSSNLPAWQWGRQDDGQWGVLDSNSASDSDLWIAYSLLEAGRLWNERGYLTMGHQLLGQIAAREVMSLPGFGLMMMPAAEGFVGESTWKLNPSYTPLQLLQRAALARHSPWDSVIQNTSNFLIQSSPKGLSPDWIYWTKRERFEKVDEPQGLGSYDAIRVYLWVGMLAAGTPYAAQLRRHFSAIGQFVNAQGMVAEKINVITAQGTGWAGPGFSAALLPLFKGQALEARLLENTQRGLNSTLGYYNQMLTLFGHGWFENRFQFDPQGRLVPAWLGCS